MGLWTDIRDAVLSPFNAVIDLGSDIIDGDILEGLGGFATKLQLSSYGPIVQLAAQSDVGQSVLDQEWLNKISLGVAGNIGDVAEFNQNWQQGGNFDYSEGRDALLSYYRATGIGAAAVAGAAAAPATSGLYGTATAGLAGGTAASSLYAGVSTGDPSAIFASTMQLAGSTGVSAGLPPEISDAYTGITSAADDVQNAIDDVNSLVGQSQSAAAEAKAAGSDANKLVALAKSNTPPVSSGFSSSIGSAISNSNPSNLLLIAGGAAILLFVLKGKK